MCKVPCGFHAAFKNALNLISRNTILVRAHQVHNLKPQVERQVTILEDCSHTHSKRLPARIAFAKADIGLAIRVFLTRLGANAIKPADMLARRAAMRASWTIWPKPAFDKRERGLFVLKVWGGKNRLSHWNFSYGPNAIL
jgi:hypothetical protein